MINTRQYKRYDVQASKLDLYNSFQIQVKEFDPNIMWKDWIGNRNSLHQRVCVPWLTLEIKRKIYHQDFFKKKAIKHGSIHFHISDKKARYNSNKLVKIYKS